MKILFLVASSVFSILCGASSFAGDLIGYSQRTPENQYRVVNTEGKVVYQNIADLVKNVSLREGYGVIQDQFNLVTVVSENGNKIVDGFYGKNFRASKKLVGIYNPNGVGAVFSAENKKVYSSNTVHSLSVAEDYFGVIDEFSTRLEVYNANGDQLWFEYGVSSAQLSNAFVTSYSPTGEFTLRTIEGEVIMKDDTIQSSAVSDQFAAYIGSDGWLRVYSKDSGAMPIFNNAQIKNYGVYSKYFYVEDQLGTVIYDSNGRSIFNLGFNTPYRVTNRSVVFQLNTRDLFVVNDQGDQFTVSNVDRFNLGATLLSAETGMGYRRVYTLNSDIFGKPFSLSLSGMQDSTVTELRLGLSAVGLLYAGPQSRAEVRVGNETVFSKTFVNRLDLPINEEMLNWSKF